MVTLLTFTYQPLSTCDIDLSLPVAAKTSKPRPVDAAPGRVSWFFMKSMELVYV